MYSSIMRALLGRAQPVIPPNLYSMLMNIIAWGPQVMRAQMLQDMMSNVNFTISNSTFHICHYEI